MKFGSVFSGIGGFELGLERAGWECAWQIENEKFCNRVLSARWPSVRRLGDISVVKGSDLESVDLLAGGFPCQDLSVAGKRAGLGAARSGLFFEFSRLAGELQPRWLLIENVPGLLSSREGEDFYIVLQALSELGYGLAWRVVDSRYFGVPQRRRRVFVVGHLGGPVPYEVLFEHEGGSGDSATRGATGEDVAGTLGLGTPGARGFRSTDLDTNGAFIVSRVSTFRKVHRAQSNTDYESWERADSTNTLNLFDSGDTRATELVLYSMMPTSESKYFTARESPVTQPLMAAGQTHGNQGGDVLVGSTAVRRLTPTECERLQGFPDGWTSLCGIEPYDTTTCKCPDGTRYATLGNAVTTNVVRWIGERLAREADRGSAGQEK